MNQDTKPAPFNVGDHVRYLAEQQHEVPTGLGNNSELVLVPGMIGVIVLSTGAFSEEGESAPKPWRCQVQFQNGFQLDITPNQSADFEMATDPVSPTV